MRLIASGHYYGDIVRRLFVAASVIILLSIPELIKAFSPTVLELIIGIIIINFLAGLTNPLQSKIAFFDALISAIGFVIFEYQAVIEYTLHGPETFLFISNQLLAFIFSFALYYSVKTLRGMLLD